MEGPGTHSGAEQEKSLEEALEIGSPSPSYPNFLTPLGSLPYHYRTEIDKGYSTGWKGLDSILKGLRRGEMTVVTADTGAGKTTFCTHLMINCAMQKIPVWINSWEMKPETIMRKMASIILRRPLKICNFSDHENEQLDEWAYRYKVYINKNTIGTDVLTLGKHLAQAKQSGVEVVMLDHLDYLINTHKDRHHEAIEETMRKLHEMCFSLSMHFLLICHPRQSSTNSEEIGMHSLKGSSSIKQYADNIIILHRCARTDTQSHPGKVKIRVAKNRMFGIEGTTYLFYAPLWDGYEELTQGIA